MKRYLPFVIVAIVAIATLGSGEFSAQRMNRQEQAHVIRLARENVEAPKAAGWFENDATLMTKSE